MKTYHRLHWRTNYSNLEGRGEWRSDDQRMRLEHLNADTNASAGLVSWIETREFDTDEIELVLRDLTEKSVTNE